MKKIIIYLIPIILFSQIENNILLERQMLIKKYDWGTLHTRKVSDMLVEEAFQDTGSYIRPVMQADIFWQNASINPSWNYNDQLNYTLVPIIYGRASKDLTFYVSFMVQNGKDEIIDNRKHYLGEIQAGHRGDFEISKIKYESEHFYFKFGRDYFMPGMYFHESILFSQYQYPYDQIQLSYRNKLLEISSYYLRLNDMIYEGDRYLRHLNGHRLSINLFDKGYIALNEYILYQGIQSPINPALFNPLMIYYLYQRNENIDGTNSMMSVDFFYHFNKYFLHGEIIMDDFMTERDVYSDLEPNKFGYNFTIGIKDIVRGLNWDINYTMVRNRVYATGNGNFLEYLVYDNLPIGYNSGSNLWDIKSTLNYIDNKYLGELGVIYRMSGDDVVYSEYNTDHYQGHNRYDPLEPGAVWNEPIPYVSDGSDPDVFWGFETNHYYQLLKNIVLNLKASYWIEKGILSSNFNIAGGLYIYF